MLCTTVNFPNPILTLEAYYFVHMLLIPKEDLAFEIEMLGPSL